MYKNKMCDHHSTKNGRGNLKVNYCKVLIFNMKWANSSKHTYLKKKSALTNLLFMEIKSYERVN